MKQPSPTKVKMWDIFTAKLNSLNEKQGSTWWISFCSTNKTNLGKQDFQGARLLEWYCLLKYYILGCVQFVLSVWWMDSIKAPRCPFESSLKQSHTVRVRQVNRIGGVDFIIGISFLLDLFITWALRWVPVVLYGWIDQSNDAWKTTVVGSIFRPVKGALKEQSILLYEPYIERTNKAFLRWFLSNISTPLPHSCCRAIKWPSLTTGFNLFFPPWTVVWV